MIFLISWRTGSRRTSTRQHTTVYVQANMKHKHFSVFQYSFIRMSLTLVLITNPSKKVEKIEDQTTCLREIGIITWFCESSNRTSFRSWDCLLKLQFQAKTVTWMILLANQAFGVSVLSLHSFLLHLTCSSCWWRSLLGEVVQLREEKSFLSLRTCCVSITL